MHSIVKRNNSSTSLIPSSVEPNNEKISSKTKLEIFNKLSLLTTSEKIKNEVIKEFATLSKNQSFFSNITGNLPHSLQFALLRIIESDPTKNFENIKNNSEKIEIALAKCLKEICAGKSEKNFKAFEKIAETCLQEPGCYSYFDEAINSAKSGELKSSFYTSYKTLPISIHKINSQIKSISDKLTELTQKLFEQFLAPPSITINPASSSKKQETLEPV